MLKSFGKFMIKLADGLLYADQIGFHTNQYSENFARFIRYVKDILDSDDTKGKARSQLQSSISSMDLYIGKHLPLQTRVREEDQGQPDNQAASILTDGIGINLETWAGADTSSLANDETWGKVKSRSNIPMDVYLKQICGRKLILGVDRLDPSKGLRYKLDAYKKALEADPDKFKDAVLFQITVSSRDTVPRYKRLLEDLKDMVTGINKAAGEGDDDTCAGHIDGIGCYCDRADPGRGQYIRGTCQAGICKLGSEGACGGSQTHLGCVTPAEKREMEAEAMPRKGNTGSSNVSFPKVIHEYGGVPQDILVELYRRAHVMLVTAFIDGMNLVTHEYIATQHANDEKRQACMHQGKLRCDDSKHPVGTLLMPRSIGSAQAMEMSLGATQPYAVLVKDSPKCDAAKGLQKDCEDARVENIKQRLIESMSMSSENRHAMHTNAFSFVSQNTIEKWAEDFIDRGTL